MREDIEFRITEEARYISETGATVRETAKAFHFSKSTIHKDVTERLYYIDRTLYNKVQKGLRKNLNERHLRGGLATREKYLKAKSDNT